MGTRKALEGPAGCRKDGGSVWESNPPTRVLAGQAGFEDQSSHQARSAPFRRRDSLPGSRTEVPCHPENGLHDEGTLHRRDSQVNSPSLPGIPRGALPRGGGLLRPPPFLEAPVKSPERKRALRKRPEDPIQQAWARLFDRFGDVLGSWTLIALNQVELNPLTFGKRTEPASGDGGVVDEAVPIAPLGCNESETLGIVEPFDGSVGTHPALLLIVLSGSGPGLARSARVRKPTHGARHDLSDPGKRPGTEATDRVPQQVSDNMFSQVWKGVGNK